ncbi:hypothetical protein QBC46DRAFT_458821 [Diplogelasinospora grovesii]|uniref:Uncharacterized protein n=1 Tax=Diplogelasinospora grovesii TaxID=303347 RepID=A0AAN6N7K1_9PEZI|nr:hypothetical protein QBC46DRAFT_458821 [Diplogelasinospora grovesii]
MAPSRWAMIPRGFSWLLPVQSLVAGVAIYSAIYVFTLGSIPFILAVVAAGLHFILGLYCCFTQNKPGAHHLYIIPVWLVICAGVWCGPVYYFGRQVDAILKSPDGGRAMNASSSQSQITTWSEVGCGTSALNVLLDLCLLSLFLRAGIRRSPPRGNTFISAPVHAAPPATEQYQTYQNQQYHTQQQQAPGPQRMMTGDYKSPTTTLNTVSFPSNLPGTVSPTSPTMSPTTTVFSQSQQTAAPRYPYDRNNRIDVVRRLCSLQNPDGHWDYSDELAELVSMWGGRELMAPAHGVTALTHACLMDLCGYVWAAQREGREHQALSTAELISLQAVNWDLGWAKNALDRATAWMSGFR